MKKCEHTAGGKGLQGLISDHANMCVTILFCFLPISEPMTIVSELRFTEALKQAYILIEI